MTLNEVKIDTSEISLVSSYREMLIEDVPVVKKKTTRKRKEN